MSFNYQKHKKVFETINMDSSLDVTIHFHNLKRNLQNYECIGSSVITTVYFLPAKKVLYNFIRWQYTSNMELYKEHEVVKVDGLYVSGKYKNVP